ncbi:hypothetical protein MJO29_016667 [Puccinia striiformis f. sp. tritici]|nr:hypothetical protein MJO29_016667 [Puccinia striiformis f. sp. tritici]
MEQKVLNVCMMLRTLPQVMTPKEFMIHFVRSTNPEVAYLRRLWAVPRGIPSSMDLVRSMRNELTNTPEGRDAWDDFIQQEANRIATNQAPPRGNYPVGQFHSSSTGGKEFFTSSAMMIHDRDLSERNMPFLYNLVLHMLRHGRRSGPPQDEEDPGVNDPAGNQDTNEAEKMLGISYEAQRNPVACVRHRDQRMALTRVHEYCNYLGLAASRKTAIAALKTLAQENARNIRRVMEIQEGLALAPTLCIDNIDMEQRVHQQSVGNRTSTFRGTWGYVHLPNKALIDTLDTSELNLKTFKEAVGRISACPIEPRMFLPTVRKEHHEIAVWKSQIARVLNEYITVPADRRTAYPLDPPVIEQVDHTAPELLMLKLMKASDNLAEGIGQVFQSIITQSGLSVNEFFKRLQPFDGDLGTVQNFNCLRQQRAPSTQPQHCMENIYFQLGASHTLWNVGSNIFSHHFGNPKDSNDTGAWQHLEALGFPSEKAIQKKDITLMINQMERVFEANIYYCLRVVMDLAWQKPGVEKINISSAQWNSIIVKSYATFCTPQARTSAVAQKCVRLSNTMLLLHDFLSVVEAQRSMSAGDMVLMLTVWLPGLLSKYLRHNLLISPSWRPGHFVAKDFELEKENYWLKFLFNNTGQGTNVDRLCDTFSPNVFLLQQMFQSLKEDCGAQIVHQSHKNKLPHQSLVMFSNMGLNWDILGQHSNKDNKNTIKVVNTYLAGIQKLKTTIRMTDIHLNKFKKHLNTQTTQASNEERINSDDDNDTQSEDM